MLSAMVVIDELLNREVEHIYVTDCNQKRVHDVIDMFAERASFLYFMLIHDFRSNCSLKLAYHQNDCGCC